MSPKYMWFPASTTVSGEWDYRPQADLIVSELLGSFADNELSPECLDGAVTGDGWVERVSFGSKRSKDVGHMG